MFDIMTLTEQGRLQGRASKTMIYRCLIIGKMTFDVAPGEAHDLILPFA